MVQTMAIESSVLKNRLNNQKDIVLIDYVYLDLIHIYQKMMNDLINRLDENPLMTEGLNILLKDLDWRDNAIDINITNDNNYHYVNDSKLHTKHRIKLIEDILSAIAIILSINLLLIENNDEKQLAVINEYMEYRKELCVYKLHLSRIIE